VLYMITRDTFSDLAACISAAVPATLTRK